MLKATNVLAIATILMSGTAQASTFNCNASLQSYYLSLTGHIAGNRVVGSVIASVLQDGKLLHRSVLPVTSSRFSPSQALLIQAADTHSSVMISTQYHNGAYLGPAIIQSEIGNVNLTATCRVR